MEDQPVRVLLVEDSPGDARLVREMLAEASSSRFEVTHVERLSEARRELAKEHFDVVLLDLVLPDKPRMGSLIEIHDQAARVPIVVLTGMDDDMMAMWSLEEGAQDYLVKGRVDAGALVTCLRHAIQRHKTQAGRQRGVPARFALPR